jgi:hypothetical protein
MKIDKELLEAQIKVLASQLDKDITEVEREAFEGLLNMLGDIADGVSVNPIELLVTALQCYGGEDFIVNDDLVEFIESFSPPEKIEEDKVEYFLFGEDACDVLDNEGEEEFSSEITINIVELASELAHEKTKEEMVHCGLIVDEGQMWREDENGDNIYTDKAQEFFNENYDYYYEFVKKTEV